MKNLLKKVIPRTWIEKVRATVQALDLKILVVFSKNGFLASIYYIFLSREFYREHKAILKGRIEYWRSLKDIDESCTPLRRNIHRLEKGLIMTPRRPVFGEGYIHDTVAWYKDAIRSEGLCSEEKKWAADVLREYFGVVTETAITQKAKDIFDDSNTEGEQDVKYIPYRFDELNEVSISYEQLAQLFKHRRAIRWFQKKKVPIDLVRRAIDIATLAPSACNRQPFKFYVTNIHEKAVRIANKAGGTTGFAENIQCIIAVVGQLDAYSYERDRHLIYIDAGLASMQLMLALETLGLSTCPINWPDVENRERELESLLQFEPFQRTIMLLAVGYADPAGKIPFSQKKGSDLLMKEIN